MPTYSPTQDGHRTAGDVWNDTAVGLIPGDGLDGWFGIQFTVSGLQREGERNLLLDPPRVQLISVSLRPAVINTPGTLSVYIVPEAAPTSYSNSRLPGNLGETSTKLLATHAVPDDPSFAPFTITLDPAPAMGYVNSAQWNGTIALSFHWLADNGTPRSFMSTEHSLYDNNTVLTTTESSFLTGKVGPWQAHSRVDRCPKCGEITLREKLSEDGWNEGMLVCARCWDPPEPRPLFTRPRERKGIND